MFTQWVSSGFGDSRATFITPRNWIGLVPLPLIQYRLTHITFGNNMPSSESADHFPIRNHCDFPSHWVHQYLHSHINSNYCFHWILLFVVNSERQNQFTHVGSYRILFRFEVNARRNVQRFVVNCFWSGKRYKRKFNWEEWCEEN